MDVNRARESVAAFLADTTNPPAPRPRWLRRGGVDLVEAVDVLIALICFLTQNSWATQAGVPLSPLLAFATSVPVALRTRLPFTAWAASAVTAIGTQIVSQMPMREAAPAIVYGLCLYALTVRCAPRVIVMAVAVTAAGGFLIQSQGVVVVLLLAAIPLLSGAVVRTRRSGSRRLAEQERKHSGERTLLEERQRIARELHDVVAHHMSVIAIQAEAAPYQTADPPPELVESFGEIRQSALTGLTELRRLLGVLRTGSPDTAPQPGLGDLDTLLDSARSGGLSVTADASGEPVPLPDGVDLSAYRILQEALSNAMRHAPGSHADVRITYRGASLELDVRNDAGANGSREGSARDDNAGMGPVEGGHGIIGMRERTAMLGGTLFAEPVQGGFRVHAVLPLRRDPGEADAREADAREADAREADAGAEPDLGEAPGPGETGESAPGETGPGEEPAADKRAS